MNRDRSDLYEFHSYPPPTTPAVRFLEFIIEDLCTQREGAGFGERCDVFEPGVGENRWKHVVLGTERESTCCEGKSLG